MKGITKTVKNHKWGFLGNVFGPIEVGLPLKKNVITAWAKSFLIQLALTATQSATNPAI